MASSRRRRTTSPRLERSDGHDDPWRPGSGRDRSGTRHRAGRRSARGQHNTSIIGVDIAEAEETRGLVRANATHWLGIIADASSPGNVARVAEQALARFGRCDILVNNAGVFPACAFNELSFDEWRKVLATNLDSQFLMSQGFVPPMKERGWGRIVNFTSSSVQLATERTAAYKASKMGTIGLTRGMAADLGNTASPSTLPVPQRCQSLAHANAWRPVVAECCGQARCDGSGPGDQASCRAWRRRGACPVPDWRRVSFRRRPDDRGGWRVDLFLNRLTRCR